LSDALEDLARANKLVTDFVGHAPFLNHEDRAHSHACARSRRNTGKATDRRREAAR